MVKIKTTFGFAMVLDPTDVMLDPPLGVAIRCESGVLKIAFTDAVTAMAVAAWLRVCFAVVHPFATEDNVTKAVNDNAGHLSPTFVWKPTIVKASGAALEANGRMKGIHLAD